MPKNSEQELKYILRLLTNRDSDNVGDQIIEACDIAILSTIMQNLGFESNQYKIISNAAGIISKKYLQTQDQSLLDRAKKRIKNSHILIFGGAPLFNYGYQNFYLRTIKSLEIAQQYNTPVIFSSIGIEEYNEENEKCQQLKASINSSIVKQITTRDDLSSLEQYQDNKNLKIGKVADPAVFTNLVFKNFLSPPKEEPMIGLAVVRHRIFEDNGINFPLHEQIRFWKETREKLLDKGFKCQFFTTGHFSDEAFLQTLQKELSLSPKECVYNMNYPEKLVQTIYSYKAIIAFRLHANITAYSLGIPAIGLTWNQKVPLFYDAINYPDRVFGVEDWNWDTIVAALEKAVHNGVNYDQKYAMTVYNTLFDSIKDILDPGNSAHPFSYDELLQIMEPFLGTSDKEKQKKLTRKFKRAYENYNKLDSKLEELKEKTKRNPINSIKRPLKRLFRSC